MNRSSFTHKTKLSYNLIIAPRHKFGYELPRSNRYDYVIKLDKANNNTKW